MGLFGANGFKRAESGHKGTVAISRDTRLLSQEAFRLLKPEP